MSSNIEMIFDDPVVNLPRITKWEKTVEFAEFNRKCFGRDSWLMSRYMEYDEYDENEVEPEDLKFEEGKLYKAWELDQIATNILKEDTRRELCRTCDEYGDETGHVESQPQAHSDGSPLVDDIGAQLYVDFPELRCTNGHIWYKGEGKARGNGGRNPVLFKEHLKNRQSREIYTTVGTPDPEIVSGLFNRTHPQGRKVNSAEQRSKHGASFYR